MRIRNSLPYWFVQNRHAFLRYVQGVSPRECNICGFEGRFRAAGFPLRPDARCPLCDSLERHRLLVLAIQEMSLVRPADRVLHFAAEPAVIAAIAPRSMEYRTADLYKPDADMKLNIESLDLPDSSIDVVVCSHVLEHVDDVAALSEIQRVLRSGGRLVAMVPIIEGWDSSYEDPAVRSPRDREIHFGQFDHVRYYGRDFRQRVREAGFILEEYVATAECSVRLGLARGERVFIGHKT